MRTAECRQCGLNHYCTCSELVGSCVSRCSARFFGTVYIYTAFIYINIINVNLLFNIPHSVSLQPWSFALPIPESFIFFDQQNVHQINQAATSSNNLLFLKPRNRLHTKPGGVWRLLNCFLWIYLTFLIFGSLIIQKIIKFLVDRYNTRSGHTKLSTTNTILIRGGGVWLCSVWCIMLESSWVCRLQSAGWIIFAHALSF